MGRKESNFYIMRSRAIIVIFILLLMGYAYSNLEGEMRNKFKEIDIQANLVFFYYKDLAQAVKFYEETLGLNRVLDYGFAKIFRISKSSFVGLVDEKEGMHTTKEPKTVTLSFISNEIDEWYHYLKVQRIKIHSPLKSSSRIFIRGFVALDPEGYFLEFQTFLENPMNKKLLPILKKIPTFYTELRKEPSRRIGFKGNIIWLYYKDLSKAQGFYEEKLGLRLLVDQGTSKLYTSSESGFIGLVDEAHGLHRFTEKKAVNVSFFVRDVDSSFKFLQEKGLKFIHPLSKVEKDKVRAFVIPDLAGYYLEFDKFLDHQDNQNLLKILQEK